MAIDVKPHVVVVGGGLAGLSAANEALKHGAMVTMVEKETLTGNSAKATSGVNAVQTKWQQPRIQSGEIEDGVELFYQDIMKAGHWKNKPDLAITLAALSGSSLDTMAEDFNLTLSDIQQLGGHNAKRTHRFPPIDGRVVPVGWTIVAALKKAFLSQVEAGNAFLLAPYRLSDFELEEKPGPEGTAYPSVSSVTLECVKDGSIQTITNLTGLIITTGGFAALSTPESLIGRYRPDLIGYPTTNGPFSCGDALVLSEKKGLSLIDLEYVQLHPTGFIDPKDPCANRKFLCPEVMRGVGAIIISRDGERFVNELLPRDQVTAMVTKHGTNSEKWGLTTCGEQDNQKIVMLVMDQDVANRFGIEAFNFYLSKGFIKKIENPSAMESELAVSSDRFQKTVEEYNRAVDGVTPDPYGKSVFPGRIDISKPFYVSYITPSLHFTMGGVEIDPTSRAIVAKTRKIVANLFVAGETSGGVHGANRLGGNGCLESVVFGQLSGRLSARAFLGVGEISLKGKQDLVVSSTAEDDVITLMLPSITSVVNDKEIKLKDDQFIVSDRFGTIKGSVKALSFFSPKNQTGVVQVKIERSAFKIYPGLKLTGVFN